MYFCFKIMINRVLLDQRWNLSHGKDYFHLRGIWYSMGKEPKRIITVFLQEKEAPSKELSMSMQLG